MSVLVKEPEAIMEIVSGFDEETVRALSASRNEPEWMLDFRLAAWRQFRGHAVAQIHRRTLAAHAPDRLRPEAVSSRSPFRPAGRARADLSPVIQDELHRDGQRRQPCF